MSYGLSVVNDYGAVVIDSDHKVLIFSERGNFNIQSRYTDREGYGNATFTKPILTQEPPQLFVRYVSGLHSNLGIYTTMLGSPGNWTGFRVTSAVRGNPNLQNYLMEYVSCKYAYQHNESDYGMEVYDKLGDIVFTSGDRIVRFGKFTKDWSLTVGNSVDIYRSGLAIDVDDFICVSAIDRGVMWFADHSNYTGLTILDGGVRVLNITTNVRTAGGEWFISGVGGTSFCIPVCKFPVDKYYN